MTMAVIVPSRGRPENIERLQEAWVRTGASSRLVVVLDDDDPRLMDYLQIQSKGKMDFFVGERLRLVGSLNRESVALTSRYQMLGFCGDDHVPRTKHWDRKIVESLKKQGTGFAYGNDGVWGPELCTSWFMTSDIVRTLGYMIPPVLTHMYADNAVLTLAKAIDRLTYLPDVLIEHMHPIVLKALPDGQYAEVGEFMEPDRIAFEKYKADGSFDADVAKLKALIDG